MKIKVKKEVTEEKELSLPYFFKHNYTAISPVYFALFDEERCMKVAKGEAIECCPTQAVLNSCFNHDLHVECSEAEFTEAYEATIETLTKMIPVAA